MGEQQISCAAMPLRADGSEYALVYGSREGMKGLFGSQTEHLQRHITEEDWLLRGDVRCLIGDASASVLPQADDQSAPATLAGHAVRLLYARFQHGLPGLTLLPCEDVAHNGAHLLEAMIACAVQWRLPGDFLRWLVAENAACSTLDDCAEWLIETDHPLPVRQAEGVVRYVRALEPYRLRRQWLLGGAGVLVSAIGFLCGLDTVGAAMRDGDIRRLLGNALTREMLPAPELPQEEGLAYAARVCAYLENACGSEAWPVMGERLAARFVACVLPAIAAYEKREGALPACLCFGLSALIMLYAGVRRNAAGEYILPSEQGDAPVLEEEAVLDAFSRMSCDMPPESLAYAALSDQEIWGCDLREVTGLEELITRQLRDMQLLGVRAAMRQAAE